MKVLLDGCVWGGAALFVAHAGHEVETVADWSRDPGDHEILSRAFQSSQVVVTIDKDFGDLAVVHRLPHRGIIRLAVSLRYNRERSLLKYWPSTARS